MNFPAIITHESVLWHHILINLPAIWEQQLTVINSDKPEEFHYKRLEWPRFKLEYKYEDAQGGMICYYQLFNFAKIYGACLIVPISNEII